MRNSITLGICLALACAVICHGEDYMLVIDEVEAPDVPMMELPGGIPSGFPMGPVSAEVTKKDLARMNVLKSTELLISTDSRFHLRIEDNSSILELNGQLQKGEVAAPKPSVPAGQPASPPMPHEPPKKTTAAPGQELMLAIECNFASKPGHQSTTKYTMPMRCGPKYRTPGGNGSSVTTLLSLAKVNTDAEKSKQKQKQK